MAVVADVTTDAGMTTTRAKAPNQAQTSTVTLSVASRDAVTRRARAAFDGQDQGAHISFASAELLWQTLTRNCWELLHAITGQGAMSIRKASRRIERDVKRCTAMSSRYWPGGLLRRVEGGVSFRFDAEHVDLS